MNKKQENKRICEQERSSENTKPNCNINIHKWQIK